MTTSSADSLITAVDHLVVLCPDFDLGLDIYSRIMGFGPTWVSQADGQKTALFQTRNIALELLAPFGQGAQAEHVRDLIAKGVRLASLVYRSPNAQEARRILGRRGLSPSDLSNHSSKDLNSGKVLHWTRFRLDTHAMGGVKSFILEPSEQLPPSIGEVGFVTELDHLVVQTPNPERAVATYGGRLGLRLALDRTETRWNTRFLFFRLGGLTLEIIQRLNQQNDPNGMDELWGLTWGTDDIEACHARLAGTGANVSAVRDGRKPGSRIFTLRDHNLGVPTLFIQQGAI